MVYGPYIYSGNELVRDNLACLGPNGMRLDHPGSSCLLIIHIDFRHLVRHDYCKL